MKNTDDLLKKKIAKYEHSLEGLDVKSCVSNIVFLILFSTSSVVYGVTADMDVIKVLSAVTGISMAGSIGLAAFIETRKNRLKN